MPPAFAYYIGGLAVAVLWRKADGFLTNTLDIRTPITFGSDVLQPLCFQELADQSEWLRQKCCETSECLSDFFNYKRCCQRHRGFRARAVSLRQRLLACERSAPRDIGEPRHLMSSYSFSVQNSFGRILWCAAREARVAFDLFMGEGGSVWILADAMLKRGGHVVTFEKYHDLERISELLHGLDPVIVHGDAMSDEELTGKFISSYYPSQLMMFHGRPYPEYSEFEGGAYFTSHNLSHSHLWTFCRFMRPDFVVVDAPSLLVREWLVIETECQPSMVLLGVTNLPGSHGWIRDRLLMYGDWAEILTGALEDHAATALLVRLRRWSLLVKHVNNKSST